MTRFRSPAWALTLLVMVCASALVGCAATAGSGLPPDSRFHPFFFILATDPQFGMIADNKDFVVEEQRWEKTIAEVNRLHPDFFVVCGDLTQKTGDPEQIGAFQRVTHKLDQTIPLHLVAGNHDVANDPTPATLAAYRKEYGPDWYSFDHLSCHFVVINSTIIKAPQNVPGDLNAQSDWLEKNLRTAAAVHPQHTVVFQHHPPFFKAVDELDHHDNLPPPARQVLLDLFRRGHVDAVFAGHAHRNILARNGGLSVIVTNAVSRSMSFEPPGFRIVKVFADHLEYNYVPLDKVPEKITVEAEAAVGNVPG